MIFNLFKRKNNWQHKDSNIRIAAINEELKIDSNDDKTILLSLLNEDSNELVRRAVLLKLNSIDEYFNASFTNDKKTVQVFAMGQVQDILAGKHKIILASDKKQAFLTKVTKVTNTPNATTVTNERKEKTADVALLSHWLEHEVEPSLILNLFEILVKKKNTAQFLLHVFTKKQSAKVQKSLLSLELKELKDASLLTKLSKKSVNDEVIQLINDRLAQLIEQTEKPKRLLKQKQLLLSKLLALKDQPNYAQYLTNKTDLEQQWQHDLSDITCLSEDEQQMLLSKFTKITRQLTQIFAPKKEAYHQAKIAEQLHNDKKVAKDDFNKVITELNQKITTAVFEGHLEGNVKGDVEGTFEGNNTEDELLNQYDFSNKLTQLNEKIAASALNAAEQAEFLQKSAQLEKRLTQLPEIAQSVSEATYLISKISQLALPQSLSELNDRQQTYYDWLDSYKAVNKKAQGVLPQSIIDAHKEITQAWQRGLKPLQKEQKQLFDQTKKKLIDLKRLHANGKYKVCFGLFKGVSQAIILLSSQQQLQLQRDFDNVSEKMAEVSDWEHYIATPRKQELLVEINALITTPLDEPNAQADKVKHYRKTWNSLGHADETIDKELNDQFNLACEQAFAPCRLFYAEQEKLRAMHLVTRNKIVEDAARLAETIKTAEFESSSIDFKELDGKLNKLQQRWQQSGEVDRQEYQKLFREFKNTIKPVNNAIKHFHDTNGTLKQALIVKAEQQLIIEDIYQAIETIKNLQQQWRDIGFAGSHQESKLWQTFRSINDQVFAKRDQAKTEQQAELTQLAENYNQALANIKGNMKANAVEIDETAEVSIEKASLVYAKEKAQELLSQVIANKPVIKSVATAIEAFIKQLSAQIAQKNVEQENKSWLSLFTILEKVAQDEFVITADNISDEAEYQQLTSFWQKRLTEQCLLKTQASAESRADKTLALEVLAQVESPAELAQQRMAVQVSLMQEQMQSSETIDLQQSFADWLSLGKLEVSDFALLARIKKIFIS